MPETTFPTKGDMTPEAVRARMAQFCEWFGGEPVKLKVRAGRVYMTDELLAWHDQNGASLDWILLGEAKALARAYRDKHQREAEFLQTLKGFDDVEKAWLMEALIAGETGDMKAEMQAFKAKVEAHRAAKLPEAVA